MSRVTGAAVVVAAVALLWPATAKADGIELRGGGFFPRAEANIFDDTTELFTVDRDDWTGFAGGIEYSLSAGRRVEIGFHIDGYGRQHRTSYRDFVRDDDSEIRQTLRLSVVPIGASVRFLPAGRRARVSPYVAAGVDVVAYQYEEFGDFIDFDTDDLDISSDRFESTGAAFGYHAAAGVRFGLGTDFSLTGEVRYLGVGRRSMNDDFFQNDIDLSGTQATIGLHLRF
jgi:opacity protein-like surface antigen